MASAPPEERRSCFQVIEDGLAYPPVLLELKRHTVSTSGHRPPSSAQSNSKASISLHFQAVRFLNGKQEMVQISLGGGGNDNDAGTVKMDHDALVKAVSGRKGLNKPSMTYQECCDAVHTRFEEGRYVADYRKDSHTLQITLNDLKEVDISFNFAQDVKKTPAAAAFVIAFEAACEFSRLLKTTRTASEQAAEELRLKDKELRKVEKMANNLSSDLSNERQRMQRLLSSGGSSLEDVLNPRSLTGKAGRRSASSIMDMSMPVLDPGSPRKKRKAADAVLTKAGRTAQKETKTGFIDEDDEEEDEDNSGRAKSARPSASVTKNRQSTKAGSSKPSSTDTASSAAESRPKGRSGQGSETETASSHSKANASKARKKVAVQPTLSGRRAMKSVKSQPKEGWLEEDEEEDSKAGGETEASARKPTRDTRATRAANTTGGKSSEGQRKGEDVAASGADSDTATDKTE